MNELRLSMMIKRLRKQCTQRLERIKQLEAERDALLTDLRATDPCDNCKYCGDNCKDCEEDEHWEWRGVKEEEK